MTEDQCAVCRRRPAQVFGNCYHCDELAWEGARLILVGEQGGPVPLPETFALYQEWLAALTAFYAGDPFALRSLQARFDQREWTQRERESDVEQA